MQIIEIQPEIHDWLYFRQIFSLSLLKKINTKIIHGMKILTDNPQFLPLYHDVKNFLQVNQIAKIVETANSIQIFPQMTKHFKFNIHSGKYSSAMEIALLMLPILFNQNMRSILQLNGTTNSPLSYPTAFIDKSLFGILEKAGLFASVKLKRFGFYGSGGGKAEMKVYPYEPANNIDFSGNNTTDILSIKIVVSKISKNIAQREKEYFLQNLNIPESNISIIEVIDANGYGNVVHISCNYQNIPILLFRELPVYNENGDFIFDEENNNSTLSSLITETKAVVSNNNLPLPLLREIIMILAVNNIPDGIKTHESILIETKRLNEKFS